MSRGLGAVQRRILELLRENTADPFDDFTNRYRSWTTVRDLAAAFCVNGETHASRSLIESTRRAVLKLHNADLVEITYVRRRVYSRYVFAFNSAHPYVPREYADTLADRLMLAARLPLAPERQEAYEQAGLDHERELARKMAPLLAMAKAAL